MTDNNRVHPLTANEARWAAQQIASLREACADQGTGVGSPLWMPLLMRQIAEVIEGFEHDPAKAAGVIFLLIQETQTWRANAPDLVDAIDERMAKLLADFREA